MASQRAHVCIVRGDVEIFGNNSDCWGQVLQELGLSHSSRARKVYGDSLALAPKEILDSAGRALPNTKLRGLRDVLHSFRHVLSASLARFVREIYASYALSRHLTDIELLGRAHGIALALAKVADDTAGSDPGSVEMLRRTSSPCTANADFVNSPSAATPTPTPIP